jgi:hypothetical protein
LQAIIKANEKRSVTIYKQLSQQVDLKERNQRRIAFACTGIRALTADLTSAKLEFIQGEFTDSLQEIEQRSDDNAVIIMSLRRTVNHYRAAIVAHKGKEDKTLANDLLVERDALVTILTESRNDAQARVNAAILLGEEALAAGEVFFSDIAPHLLEKRYRDADHEAVRRTIARSMLVVGFSDRPLMGDEEEQQADVLSALITAENFPDIRHDWLKLTDVWANLQQTRVQRLHDWFCGILDLWDEMSIPNRTIAIVGLGNLRYPETMPRESEQSWQFLVSVLEEYGMDRELCRQLLEALVKRAPVTLALSERERIAALLNQVCAQHNAPELCSVAAEVASAMGLQLKQKQFLQKE